MRAMRNSSLGFALALLAAISFAGCSKTGQSSSQPNFTQQPGSSSAPAASSEPGSASSSFSSAAPAQEPQSSAQPAPQPVAITVPAGTRLNVVLDRSISSATAQAGDSFGATLVDPVRVQGQAVIPQNARVSGHVVAARASGRLSGVAELVLTLDSVRIGGNSYNIQTSTISRRGSSHKKRDIVAIGGGSALGAIIGGIAGGGKGAAIGAVAGGGAGTAGAAVTGKKNVALPAEASLIFRLEAPLTVQQ
jgi:hypothetical protein